MKTLVILVGEMGSGKSYWGREFATLMDFKFIEGDDYLPPTMREAVDRFGRVTEDMKGMLLNGLRIVLHRELMQVRPHGGVVLSQALYNEADRQFLTRHFKAAGYTVDVYWVKPGFWRNLKQLWRRPRGLRWVLYWLMSKPWFEKPLAAYVIDRDATVRLRWFV
jgi:gluconate kinase